MTSFLKLNHLAFIFLLWLMAAACVRKSSDEMEKLPFTIEGKLEGHSGDRIFLSALQNGEFVMRDTASISREGTFRFQGEITAPDVFRLSLTENNALLMVIDARCIEVRCDANSLQQSCEVKGSEASADLEKLMVITGRYQEEIASVEKKFMAAQEAGKADSLIVFQEKYFDLNSAYKRDVKEFIRQYPASFTGPYAAYAMLGEEDAEFVDSALVVFNESIPGSKYVQLLNERAARSNTVSVGALVPEINLPQPDGTPLSLSSLKGEYVLLDFWASWCRPCREENPNMVKLYQRYKSKGFEILGISLDESKEQWLEAIREDQLPWRHVSDLKGVNSAAVRLYQVQAIPMTVLLDEEGRMIALNLRGPSLESKLEELFEPE